MHPDLHHNWEVVRRGGPVITTAIHAGHALREELLPYWGASTEERHREEDPLTDQLIWGGYDSFRCYNSRFEVDLNRPRARALSSRPQDTWGLALWREQPPPDIVERSLAQHDAFYALMREWIEALIAAHGVVLVLDVHSYNHRRDGATAVPAPAESNPDIDLGLTTLDHARFGTVAERFAAQLADSTVQGRSLDVRANVRYPDGGHFPEWVYASYGENVCTITLEYKKFYMDEWTGQASLPTVQELQRGLSRARDAAVMELLQPMSGIRKPSLQGVEP